jgi:cellulose synthase/poly-beta-1,6-N-acetylglucosamine synthase-like glycosyltransferase
MSPWIWTAIGWMNGVVLVYFVVLNSAYLMSSLAAFRALRRYTRRLRALDLDDLLGSPGVPPITLLAPAYNEEANCVEAIRSLLMLRYADFEVIVVNDGSKDATVERLREAFDLVPANRLTSGALPTAAVQAVYQSRSYRNLWVIDKLNGGKADALNAGLNFTRTPLFCAIDADSLLEYDALSRIVRPFLEDKTTIAAGGIIRIANGCTVQDGNVVSIELPTKLLARLQVLEYLRAFLAGRMGWQAAHATMIISGAFGAFRRDVVLAAGGYATDTVGEDMELVVRLHRYCRERKLEYQIAFVPDPVAWTECPVRLRVLRRQRDRWQRGLIETLMRHRTMLLNPRYGRIGLVAYPFFFFLEMLGPPIELAGYLSFVASLLVGRISSLYVMAFFLVAIVLGSVLSIAAVALEELSFHRYPKTRDLAHLIWLGIAENFGYRQLTAWWRLGGTVSALRRKRGWGKQERRGFTAAPLDSSPGSGPPDARSAAVP